MNKTASLAVKSLLGVGSVASAAGGGVIFWKRGFSKSTEKEKVSDSPKEDREEAQEKVENLDNSKSDKGNQMAQGELQITGNSLERREDDKGSLKQQNDAEDLDSPEVKARKEKEAKKMEQDSKNWKDGKATLESEEKSWLPEACNTEDRGKRFIECNLSSGDLKKIKFKELEEGKGEVTVTPKDSVNVKLKIFLLGDLKKKFLFTNGSSTSIVVSKGDKNVTLKGNSSTEFLREKEGLVMEKLKDYGIPEKCLKENKSLTVIKPEYSRKQNIKGCVLSVGELSKIKFHGFTGEGESVVTQPWVGSEENGWNHDQAIVLTTEEGKYSFYNYFSDLPWDGQLGHRPIKITRGNVSVTLDGNMESEFTVEDGGLKKQEVTDLGFPKNCEMGEKEENECVLSDNDIRRLKLKETGVSPDIKYGKDDGEQEMNLRIEKADEGNFPGGKKYILSAKGDYSITISSTTEVKDGVGKTGKYGTNTLTFENVGDKKTFKNEDNYLVLVG